MPPASPQIPLARAPTITPRPGYALRSALRAAFWTVTVVALPAALLTSIAWFVEGPALFAQLSPFRIQYAVLLSAHALFCLLLRRTRWAALFAAFALLNAAAVIHGARLLPSKSPPVPPTASAAPPLKIVYANVLTANPDPAPLLALVAAENPDLVALLEVDARWRDRLVSALSADFPFQILRPREDNFGLALFSRAPFADARVEFFADAEIPSVSVSLARADGAVRVLLTHPMPPGDDASTLLRNRHLAELVRWRRSVASPTVLVLGDFNAAPWCPPLRRLLPAAGLRPAAGDHRRLAATWPVAVPFLRIPLDQALLGPGLACVSYRVASDVGSDHFPLVLTVAPAAPGSP